MAYSQVLVHHGAIPLGVLPHDALPHDVLLRGDLPRHRESQVMVPHENPHLHDDRHLHHRLASRHHHYQFIIHLDCHLVCPHHLSGRLHLSRLGSLDLQMVRHHQSHQYLGHPISTHRPNLINHYHRLVRHHHAFRAQDLG